MSYKSVEVGPKQNFSQTFSECDQVESGIIFNGTSTRFTILIPLEAFLLKEETKIYIDHYPSVNKEAENQVREYADKQHKKIIQLLEERQIIKEASSVKLIKRRSLFLKNSHIRIRMRRAKIKSAMGVAARKAAIHAAPYIFSATFGAVAAKTVMLMIEKQSFLPQKQITSNLSASYTSQMLLSKIQDTGIAKLRNLQNLLDDKYEEVQLIQQFLKAHHIGDLKIIKFRHLNNDTLSVEAFALHFENFEESKYCEKHFLGRVCENSIYEYAESVISIGKNVVQNCHKNRFRQHFCELFTNNIQKTVREKFSVCHVRHTLHHVIFVSTTQRYNRNGESLVFPDTGVLLVKLGSHDLIHVPGCIPFYLNKYTVTLEVGSDPDAERVREDAKRFQYEMNKLKEEEKEQQDADDTGFLKAVHWIWQNKSGLVYALVAFVLFFWMCKACVKIFTSSCFYKLFNI